jgi:hypothetical protein
MVQPDKKHLAAEGVQVLQGQTQVGLQQEPAA